MSTEGTPQDTLAHLSMRREAVGQIRFEPSESFCERLADVYLPEKREMARRAIFLSSQYRVVAQLGPGGTPRGVEGQVADRIHRSLQFGKDRRHLLGRYMRRADKIIGGHEMTALQFAIHLDPRVAAAIHGDEMLIEEQLLQERSPIIKALLVYDGASIHEGKKRDAAIRAIGEFVTGYEIIPADGGNEAQKSPNQAAYTSNLRFAFSPIHKRS